jgi:hypothetical protein
LLQFRLSSTFCEFSQSHITPSLDFLI